jgi:hypothetical protein
MDKYAASSFLWPLANYSTNGGGLGLTLRLRGAALFAASLSNAMLGDFSEQTRKSSAALFFT